MTIDIADEISKMTELLQANTAAPPTDPPPTEAPPTEAPPTEAPNTPAPPTEPPETPAPPTESPTTPAPDEMEELKEEMKELREKLALQESATTSAPSTTPAPATDAPIVDEDFLDGIDLEDLTRDASKLNKILNAVMKKGVELGRSEGKQRQTQTVLAIPDMVKNNVKIIKDLQEASDEFYEDNEGLKPFKKVVALVFGEKMAKDPGKTYKEILKDVGPEVYKRLDLQKKAVKKKEEKGPKLPRNKGKGPRGKQPPETNSLVDEIGEMNKALN